MEAQASAMAETKERTRGFLCMDFPVRAGQSLVCAKEKFTPAGMWGYASGGLRFPTLFTKNVKRMGHGGFKPQVQQRIIKTSREMAGRKPWKR
jgi:hypothetical protein